MLSLLWAFCNVLAIDRLVSISPAADRDKGISLGGFCIRQQFSCPSTRALSNLALQTPRNHMQAARRNTAGQCSYCRALHNLSTGVATPSGVHGQRTVRAQTNACFWGSIWLRAPWTLGALDIVHPVHPVHPEP